VFHDGTGPRICHCEDLNSRWLGRFLID
jgi:hypothetical protein